MQSKQSRTTKYCTIHHVYYTYKRCPKCVVGSKKPINLEHEIDLLKARLAILEHSMEGLQCQHMKL